MSVVQLPRRLERIVTPTDTPIYSSASAFVDSPAVSSPPRNLTSPPSPTSQAKLSFPKLAIPTSASSTDSEILSDTDRTRSPSLLTSLFFRQSSTCSTPSQTTPVTPASGCTSKPILRRPDCTSTSTSASEDYGVAPLGKRECGLGLSVNILPNQPRPSIHRKRSTLTFAVKCSTTSEPGLSSVSSVPRGVTKFSRSPAGLPSWCDDDYDDDEDDEPADEDDDEEDEHDIMSPLFDESESEDEGYEEDQEGGFTDDEDLLGTFTDAPSWVPSDRWKACQVDSKRRQEEEEEPTSSCASPIYRCRGRKVSIATTKPDHCSRHLSPPPSRAVSPTSACPPAASSPSAIGLCRRRESRTGGSRTTSKVGWRSDDSFLHSRPPVNRASTSICPSRSILRNASEECKARSTTAEADELIALQRRVSAPVSQREPRQHGIIRGAEAYARRGSEQ